MQLFETGSRRFIKTKAMTGRLEAITCKAFIFIFSFSLNYSSNELFKVFSEKPFV